jgi:hypothetical protein
VSLTVRTSGGAVPVAPREERQVVGQPVGGEEAAVRALRAWSGSDQVGVPFGPGLGLEDAVAAVRRHLRDPAYLRSCASGVMRVAGHDLYTGRVTMEDWDRVLGHGSTVFRGINLPRRRQLACVDSAGRAKMLLYEVVAQDGPLYRQWQRDDALVAEAYAWHVVVVRRLGEAGLSDRAASLVGDPVVDDSRLSDGPWLHLGERRYERLLVRLDGPPEAIAAGGHERRRAGDLAAALFFFQKAIDMLHTHYGFSGMKDRKPSSADWPLIDAYLGTLAEVRRLRPQAPVAASVEEVTHRLRTTSTACREAGLDPGPYLRGLDRLAGIAPDVHVSDVLWKNPSVQEALGADFPLPQDDPGRR